MTRQRAFRGSYTREFLLDFAEEYDRIELQRERRASTRALLAARYAVTPDVIGKRIAAARRAGFLTPADAKGSRGGELTTRAAELIKERKGWGRLPLLAALKLRRAWLKKL